MDLLVYPSLTGRLACVSEGFRVGLSFTVSTGAAWRVLSGECVRSQHILQASWALPRAAVTHRVFSPFEGALEAGCFRVTVEDPETRSRQAALQPGAVGSALVSALSLGCGCWHLQHLRFCFHHTCERNQRGPRLWCSGAPVHFPVTGKGPAWTRGLCGVSRHDKHCPGP